MNIISKCERRLYIANLKRRLKNKSPTIISSNCNGGFILHDLGLKFNTPTINLFFLPHDYIKFVSDLDRYLAAELVEIRTDKTYPVGMLEDITVFFMHYNTFNEAKNKWYERRERVDRNNLYLMFTDRDGCTEDDLKNFDALPYEHKVVFTHVPHPEIMSSFHIRGFEKDKEVGTLSDKKPGFFKRRYLDDFDYVSFLNNYNKRKDNLYD